MGGAIDPEAEVVRMAGDLPATEQERPPDLEVVGRSVQRNDRKEYKGMPATVKPPPYPLHTMMHQRRVPEVPIVICLPRKTERPPPAS